MAEDGEGDGDGWIKVGTGDMANGIDHNHDD